MSALGSLVVKLALEHAQYTGGLDKSEQATLASLKRIQSAADQFSTRVTEGLKNGLGGLAAFFTAGAIVNQVKSVVDQLDRIADAAAAIGVTTQTLAELGFAANQSGTDAQTLEGALGKLNIKISEAAGGNKEAVKLFAALGVQLTDTDGKVRSTEAVLADLADIFKALPEGPQKSALAVELFSKSGAGLLQFLSQGSDGIKGLREEFIALSGGSIEDAAAQAGAFNDQLDKLSVMGQAATMRFGGELLPTLVEVAEMFTATGDDALGLSHGMDLASTAGAGLRTLLEFVLLVGSDVAFVLHGIGNEIGGIAAQAVAAAKFDFAAVRNIRTEMVEDAERARKKLDEFQRRVVNPGQATASAGPTTGDVSRADRERASRAAAAALRTEDTAAKAAADSYEKLMQSIRARMALADQQLALGRELTEGEKYQAKAKEDLAKIASKLSSGQAAAAEAEIAAVKARIDQAEIEKQLAKEMLTIAQDRQRVRQTEADGIAAWFAAQEEASASTLKSLKDRLDGLRNEERAVALSRERNISLAEAIEEVAIARLKEKQAGLREGSEEYERVEREIAARRELAGVLNQQDVRQREQQGWTDMWNSVDRTAHDVFVNVFEGGSNVFKKLGQTLKASVLDVLYQMTVRPWLISIGTSIFGSGFGAAANAATGGGGGVGGLLNMASMGSNAYSLYSGGFGGTAVGQMYAGYTGATIPASMVGPSATPVSMWSNFGNTLGGGSGSGAGMGALGGAAAFTAVAALILNAVGAFRSERRVGSGLRGTLGGGDLQPWEEWREGGTLFSGPEYSTFNPIEALSRERARLQELRDMGADPSRIAPQQMIVDNLEDQYGDLADQTAAQSRAIQSAYEGLRDNVGDMADVLGISSDAVRAFTTQLGGEKGLNFEGLSTEQIQAKIAEALATANNELAQQILGTWETTNEEMTRIVSENVGSQGEGQEIVYREVTETSTNTRYIPSEYAREGEEAIDTLTRLATSLSTVNNAFGVLGITLYEASLAGGDAASTLVDAFGGLESFSAATSSYFENYYSASEREAALRKEVADTLAEAGIEMPRTRAEFRETANELLAMGEAGAEAAAAMLDVQDEFAAITEGVVSISDAFQMSGDTIKGILDNALDNAGSAAEASQMASAAFVESMYSSLQDAMTTNLSGLIMGAIQPMVDALIAGATTGGTAMASGGAAGGSAVATGGAAGGSAVATGGATAGAVMAGVLEQAKAQISAWATILADPEIQAMIGDIGSMIGGVAGVAYTAQGAWNGGGSGFVSQGSSFAGGAQSYQDALKGIGETLEEEVRRLRGLMVTDSGQSRAVLEAEFATATAAARAGDQTALAKLPSISKQLEKATEDSATSAVEVARMRGWLAGSISETMKLLGLDVPQFDVGTNYVPRDMLAMIHEGEAIVPKAYNPAAGGAVDMAASFAPARGASVGDYGAELVSEMRGVRRELSALREQGNSNTLAVQRLNLRSVKAIERVENILAMQ